MEERYLLAVLGSSIDLMYRAESYPEEGSFTHAKEIASMPGCCPLNVGVICASHGGRVKALDYLSDTEASTGQIVDCLKQWGVDVSPIQYGTCVNSKVVIIDTGDKRTMFVVDPIRPKFEETPELQELLNNAGTIYSLMHMIDRNFDGVGMLQEARRHGAKVVFDGSSDYNGKGRVEMVLSLCDGMFINREDYENFRQALGSEPKDALFARGAEFVCVTSGSEGALLYTPDREYACPSLKVEVTDSTGAGDSFAGTFLFARQQGCSYETALRLATVGGAYACTKLGGTGGTCSLEELLAFAKKHGMEVSLND